MSRRDHGEAVETIVGTIAINNAGERTDEQMVMRSCLKRQRVGRKEVVTSLALTLHLDINVVALIHVGESRRSVASDRPVAVVGRLSGIGDARDPDGLMPYKSIGDGDSLIRWIVIKSHWHRLQRAIPLYEVELSCLAPHEETHCLNNRRLDPL